LGIAINDYEYCPKLNNAVRDVQDFIDLMMAQFAFEESNVDFLKDEMATGSNIIRKLDELSEKLTPNDNLIIYFSGHGALHPKHNKGYWIPIEGRQDDYFSYVANTVIKDHLGSINAHHIFLIADSCFSGALFTKGAKDVGRRLEKYPSRWGLTSGQKEIVLDGEPGENSPFAASLLENLRKATRPIAVQELCMQVLEMTAANAVQTPLGEPLQVKGHKNGQFVFRLKKDESRDWAKAEKIGTIAAFEQFLAVYPDGQFAEAAKTEIKNSKAETAWLRIKNSTRSVDFARYKKQFPSSQYFAEAHQRLLITEEDEEWQSAKEANKITRYERYLRFYPSGRYVAEANTAINAIFNAEKEPEAWRKALAKNTIFGYKNYLSAFPDGKNKVTAQNRIDALELATKQATEKAKQRESQQVTLSHLLTNDDKKAAENTKIVSAESPKSSHQVTSSHLMTNDTNNRKKILFAVLGILAVIIVVWGISTWKNNQETELTESEKQTYDYFYSNAQEETAAKNLIATMINYNEMQKIIKTDSIAQKITDLETEQKAYEAALNDKTTKNTNAYLSIYPNGFFATELQQKLDIVEADTEGEAWQQVDTTQRIEAIAAFLQQYPDGQYADKANDKINQLKTAADETAWKTAITENTEVAYKTYLEEQEIGKYRTDAEAKIKAIKTAASDTETKAKDDAAWKTALRTNTEYTYTQYLKNFPNGQYRGQATQKIDDIKWDNAKSTHTIAAYDTYLKNRKGKYRSQAIAASDGLKPKPVVEVTKPTRTSDPFAGQMVSISSGTFQMGSIENSDERPIHSVTVSSFYMSKYEVTQKQWRDIMGTNPSNFKNCDNCPVEKVSWNDIQDFIKKLNAKTGKKYRLPTEAECEYAARGGQNYKYAGSDNIGSVAWYSSNSDSKTHPVGQKSPNGYGLYDMSGNVWEWCQDTWHDNYKNAPTNGTAWISGSDSRRVLRGGSWDDDYSSSRVVDRIGYSPSYRFNFFGFRLARGI
jgi:formylglycine-generating enzyme required for sulfatase activity